MKAAFEEWWHWPEGAKVPFTLLTDHRNLEYIRSAKRLNPWQARWSLFFSHFDFKVTYRPGSKSCKADALSRLHDSSSFLRSINETVILSTLIVARVQWDILTEITEAQANDPTPPSCPNDRTSSSSGHPGITASLQLVSEHFWWPSLEADMITIFQQCPTCNMSKSSHQRPTGLLQPLPVPQFPWSHIAIDFVTGLSLLWTPRGHSFRPGSTNHISSLELSAVNDRLRSENTCNAAHVHLQRAVRRTTVDSLPPALVILPFGTLIVCCLPWLLPGIVSVSVLPLIYLPLSFDNCLFDHDQAY